MKISYGSNYIGYSTHCPILIKVLDYTKEFSNTDVLELGMGLFSTPLLHWLCFDQGRTLISYDNNSIYTKVNKKFETDWHKIYNIDDWDKANIEIPWGIALVDHAPAERRSHDIIRLANYAVCIVVHDTDPKYNKEYNYKNAFNKFKYRYDYTKCSPHTTVLSNFIELKL